MKTELKTICLNCGLVLSDGKGRHYSANFDSSLPQPELQFAPKKSPFRPITYARCDKCVEVARAGQAFQKSLTVVS